MLWTRNAASSASSLGGAGNIDFDAPGNVLICGSTTSVTTGSDALFASYSPSGTLNWSTRLDGGAGGYDQAVTLRALPSGAVVAVGLSTTSSSADFAVWKLDQNGAVVWQRTLDGGANLADYASTLAVAASGKVLAGGARTAAVGNQDWMLAQLDLASGAVDWITFHDQAGLSEDGVFGIDVDPRGVWWVAGTAQTSAHRIEFLTRRYDQAGVQLSSARWSASSSMHSHDRPIAVRIGSACQAWVAGSAQIAATAVSSGYKTAVVQYDADGGFNWAGVFGANGFTKDAPSDLQQVPGARLAVVGRVVDPSSGGADLFALQLDLSHVPHAYCAAKTTSTGCVPRVWFTGSPSASASNDFVVRASDLRNQRTGLLFYGVSGAQAVPFHGGTLCVALPQARTPLQNSGGNAAPADDCSGMFALDMNEFAHTPQASPALLTIGTTVRCQFWGRDSGFAPPNGVDALERARLRGAAIAARSGAASNGIPRRAPRCHPARARC